MAYERLVALVCLLLSFTILPSPTARIIFIFAHDQSNRVKEATRFVSVKYENQKQNFFDEKSNKRDVLKANIQNFNDQPKAKAKAK